MSADFLPQHSDAYRFRRFLNWFPLGLAYALLYMGRYNLTVAKNALDVMTKEDFGVIFGVGAVTYGLSFLVNGPLTDKIGGKKGMVISLTGSFIMNLIMGLYIASLADSADSSQLRLTFSILYAGNMYFQSWGALSIVKVNAHWFHVRERGGFSGIFGTMISSGIFLAFTVNAWILGLLENQGVVGPEAAKWVFFAPAALIFGILLVEFFLLKDKPSLAGHEDFDTGDADSGADAEDVPIKAIMKRILTNPIILTVAAIEFCTGVLRQGVMHWFPIYAKEILVLPTNHLLRRGDWSAIWMVGACFVIAAAFFVVAKKATGRRKGLFYVSGGLVFLAPFIQGGWGGLLFVAGVIGGNVAGWVSDLFFQSRRAPAAGGLYGVLAVAALGMYFTLGGTTNYVGWASEDKKAEEQGLAQLKEGDQVLSIEGKKVEKWEDVSRTVACLPAECIDSQFDVEQCMCTGNPEKVDESAVPHGKTIAAVVIREGKEISITLPNPKTSMRAGDVRKLKAGPKTSMSPFWLGLFVIIMSTCVIGTHGLLSGTATMDFGGRKGAATAVGLIDGFVYLGTGLQSFALGYLTSKSWHYWPLFLLPFGVIGFLFTLKIWNVTPRGKGGH
jgi:OPA family glycerol-3-phosphate transporter-like MFS transporter